MNPKDSFQTINGTHLTRKSSAPQHDHRKLQKNIFLHHLTRKIKIKVGVLCLDKPATNVDISGDDTIDLAN